MKSCFFIGHRDAPESIRTDLTQAITELIEREQVQEFIVGSYGRFDQIVHISGIKKKFQICKKS